MIIEISGRFTKIVYAKDLDYFLMRGDSSRPAGRFNRPGQDALYSGVMAQDVLAHTPDAVATMPSGYYGVNYEMLGLSMERLD